MKRKAMVAGTVLLAALIILFGTYLGIGMHYETHFFEHTRINGIEVSDMTLEQAEEAVAAAVENYQVTLQTKEGRQEVISADQMEYHLISGGEIQRLLDDQKLLQWLPRYLGEDRNLTMETATSYDPRLLEQAMLSLDCFDREQVTAPSDARLEQQEDGTYQIIPETEGNQLKTEQVYQLLENAVETGQTQIDLAGEDCYEKPAVYSDDEGLLGKRDTLNRYASMTVTYYLGGDEVRTLDSATINSWMTLDEAYRPVFDRDAVQTYVAQLAADYDTIGSWEPFVTSLGETVYVEARTYGWQINQEQETEELYQVLLAGESAERSPVYYESAAARGENDIGNTYIEVDYTNQRMWFYKDGELIVDTPVVTGCVANGTESPEGIFCLVDKSEDEILKGEGYATPVEYWMPFYGGVGIHDADSWRGSSYGGTIYQTGGSHGCINTPTANAAAIYANVEIGTPIVCYKATVYQGSPSGEGVVSSEYGTAETDPSIQVLEEDWADESVYWQ
ncbi:MAG: L,D-transpeptidase family protein [Lachnospiraceae bacterium]|nr:L,D-transpeptidase family protein [Lachnospiraceae bacterium]